MAKGNQKAKQETNILSGFDEIINLLSDMADKTEITMPLVTKSLRLTVAIVKVYKEAFNGSKDKR